MEGPYKRLSRTVESVAVARAPLLGTVGTKDVSLGVSDHYNGIFVLLELVVERDRRGAVQPG